MMILFVIIFFEDLYMYTYNHEEIYMSTHLQA